MTTDSLAHGHVVTESADEVGRRWITGAALLIVADASFVVALSFTYLYLWASNTEAAFHPAKSPTASIWWSWTVTAVMLLAFVAYRAGQRDTATGETGRFVRGAGLGLILMVVALVLNIIQMAVFPFSVKDNAYSSAVFVIAAGNVFHLVITVFLGTGVVNRVRRGLVGGVQQATLRIVGVWWAWVCVASAVGAVTISVANGTLA